MLFESGDFVKAKRGKAWYGVVLERLDSVAKVYPVYANKYKVKWAGGTTSWHWGADLNLVSRSKK